MAAAFDHHGCDLEAALTSLLMRQQELVTQLRALVLPPLIMINGGSSSSSSTAELAVQLFDDVIGCNTTVVSRLQLAAVGNLLLSGTGGGGPPAAGEIVAVDDKSLVKKNSIAAAASERLEEKPNSKKRRRNDGKRSKSLVTHVPDYDGHQWRKYGQKKINGTQHVRSYYRCKYRERNCSATKTVQEQDHHQNGSSNFIYGEREVDTAKYNVVYYGDHTCMGGDSMISNANTNVDMHHHDQSSSGGGEETAARRTPEMFQGFDEGDLDQNGDHTCMGADSISNNDSNADHLHHHHYDFDHDQSSGGEGEEETTTARRTTPEMFQEFDEGDLDVPALLEVLDNSLLNWESTMMW